jgi:hypothetical protein
MRVFYALSKGEEISLPIVWKKRGETYHVTTTNTLSATAAGGQA